jgi:prophage antirepressor-like protein
MQKFKFGDRTIRVVVKYGEPWWFLSEICENIGVTDIEGTAAKLGDSIKRGNMIESKKPIIMVSKHGVLNLCTHLTAHPIYGEFCNWVFRVVFPGIVLSEEEIIAPTVSSDNSLQIFNNLEFGEIRIIEIDGKPYAVASDVAKALGYAKPNNAISSHCRCTLKWGIPHPQSNAKTIEVNIIPEGDIYRLLAHSELPKAVEFEKWVFEEVLPTLRRTGSYSVAPQPDLSNLPPELQILHQMMAVATQQAIELQQVKQQGVKNEQAVEVIQDTILRRDEDWRTSLNKMFNNAVVYSTGKDFKALRQESYEILESRAGCKLDRRLTNLKSRLTERGETKAKINSTNKLDVIESDNKLKEIYTMIVKEISIRESRSV